MIKRSLLIILSLGLVLTGCTSDLSGSGGYSLDSLLPPAPNFSFSVSYDPMEFDQNVMAEGTPKVSTIGIGTPSLTYALNSDDALFLPAGLTFDTSTGKISGTPSASLTPARQFRVNVLNGSSSIETRFSLLVRDIPIDFSYPQSVYNLKVGDVASLVPTIISGNATSWTSSNMAGTVVPLASTGLSLNSATGEISGTVLCGLTPGTYEYHISTSNTSGTSSEVFDLSFVVSARTSISLSYASSPLSLVRGTTITSATPTVSGPAGLSYSVSPALPAGLSLNSATGAISGTPSAVSWPSANYTVTANEGVCSNSQTAVVGIAVDEKPLNISLASTNLSFVGGEVITSFSPTVTASGSAATSWTLTPVAPATSLSVNSGLSFSTSTGVVSGTAGGSSVGTTFSYDVQAFNAHKSSNVIRIAITVTNPGDPLVFSYVSSPISVAKGNAVNASPTTTSGSGTTWSIANQAGTSTSISSLGLNFNTGSGAVTGNIDCAAAVGTYNYTVTGSTVSGGVTYSTNTSALTISVIARPSLALNYASTLYQYARGQSVTGIAIDPMSVTDVAFSISPALPAGISLNTQTGEVTGIASTPGYAGGSFTVTATDQVCTRTSTDSFDLVETIQIQSSPTSITTRVGSALSHTPVLTSGSSSNWSASLINGNLVGLAALNLSLNSSTGAITGTPACGVTPGTYDYRLTAANSYSSGTKDIQVIIQAREAISIAYSGSPFSLVRDTTMTTSTPVVSGPAGLAYSISPALPAGLNLNTASGVLSGTPTVYNANTSYTVTASEGVCSNSQTTSVSIFVDEKPLVISLATTAYSFVWGDVITSFKPSVSASGSSATSWTVVPVSPATNSLYTDTGLSLDTVTGFISGTPTSTNQNNTLYYDIQAHNTYKDSNVIRISIAIAPRVNPAIQYTGSPFTLQRGLTAISASPNQTAGGTISSYAISPSLPSGLSFSTSTGAITGTPPAGATLDETGTTYTVTATDAYGLTGTATANIKIVRKAPTTLSYSSPVFYRHNRAPAVTPTVTADDGAGLTYAITPALPAGLDFNTSTGVISASGYLTGSYGGPYQVTVTNSGGSLTIDPQITISQVYDKATNIFLWTGAAGDGKWSTSGNWTKKSGTASAYPQTTSDTAYFDNTCSSCNVNVDISVTALGVFMASNYTGTITQGASSTITVGRSVANNIVGCTNLGRYGEDWGWQQFGGTFNGGSSNLTFSSLDLVGGTFNSSSGTLKIALNNNLSTSASVTGLASRCRRDTASAQNVGMIIESAAVFAHGSGSVAIESSYNDDSTNASICGKANAYVKTPATGTDFYNLSFDSRSPQAANCNTGPSSTSLGSLPQYISILSGSRINVLGDLTLKRGALNNSLSTPLEDTIYFAGKLTAQCVDQSSISASTGFPNNKQDCWQGGSVGLVANGNVDQTYDISGKVGPIILTLNKTVGTVMKPAFGKDNQDIRLLKLKLNSGIFRAPAATLYLESYNYPNSLMTPYLVDTSTDASFDHNGGTLFAKTRAVVENQLFSARVELRADWTGTQDTNVLSLNNLKVDRYHATNQGENSVMLGAFGIDSDTLKVLGDLTIYDGFLLDGKIQLEGNIHYTCSTGSQCSDDVAVRLNGGAVGVDNCVSFKTSWIYFTGASNQTVTVDAGAKVPIRNWRVQKPSPYTSKLILGSNVVFSGVANIGASPINQALVVDSGIFDLNGYGLAAADDSTPGFALRAVTNTAGPCPLGGVTQAGFYMVNTVNADLMCNTSTSPDVDQVLNIVRGSLAGATYKVANPALCYEPELN